MAPAGSNAPVVSEFQLRTQPGEGLPLAPPGTPAGTPGRGVALLEAKNGARVLIVNAMGRIFMDPLDDPFAAIERGPCGTGVSASDKTMSSNRMPAVRRNAA